MVLFIGLAVPMLLYISMLISSKFENANACNSSSRWLGRCEDSYFEESREHLHLIEAYGPCTPKFDIYEMEKDYSWWFVRYHVDLEAITIAFSEMIRTYQDPSELNYCGFIILTIVREANEEDSSMVLHITGKAIRYNLNYKTFKKICDFDPGREYEPFLLVHCSSNGFMLMNKLRLLLAFNLVKLPLQAKSSMKLKNNPFRSINRNIQSDEVKGMRFQFEIVNKFIRNLLFT